VNADSGASRSFSPDARLERERRTVAAMIAVYCRAHHSPDPGTTCADCTELETYTRLRLEKCPYGETKPTCANCPIHCYQPHRREQVRHVMAFSGPRMIWRHPILAVRHMLDERRKAPPLSARSRGSPPAQAKN
jgi:hypothetical protein